MMIYLRKRSGHCIQLAPVNQIYSTQFFAPHFWDLFVDMDKSVSARAVIGMTVDHTHVRQCYIIFNVLFNDKIRLNCLEKTIVERKKLR